MANGGSHKPEEKKQPTSTKSGSTPQKPAAQTK